MAIGVTGTYSDVLFGADDFNELSWTLTPNNDPSPAYYYWATQMGWTNPAGGYIGGGYTGMQNLGSGFDDKCVLFSIGDGAIDAESDDPEAILADDFDGGLGWSTRIPYDWVVARSYRFRVYRGTTAGDGQWWNAEITDLTTSTTTQISRIKVPLAWDGINGYTIHFTERYAGATDDCGDVEYVSANFTNQRMNASTTPVAPVSTTNHYSGFGTCPNSDIANITDGVQHRMGITGDLATVAHTLTTEPDDPTAGGLYKALITVTTLVNSEPNSPYRNVITATIPTGLLSGGGATAAAASFRTRQVDGGSPGVWSSSTNIGTTGIARKSVTTWPTTRQHQIELTFIAGEIADDFDIAVVVESATADTGGIRIEVGGNDIPITVTAPAPAEPPDAPAATISTVTPTTALLTWTVPANNGGAITGYSVYAAPSGLPLTLVETIGSSVTSYLFTGLVPDTDYDFAVAAVNSAGTGDQSAVDTASTLPEGDPPNAPVINIGTITANSVRVAWAAPDSPDSPITGYRVYRAVSGGTLALVGTTITQSFTFQGLTPATAYDFAVAAYSALGDSEQSTPAAATTLASTFVPSPPAITNSSSTSTSVTLFWSSPAAHGSPITAYKVYAAEHGDTLALVATTGAVLTYEVTGLPLGAQYDFAVTAVNAVGESAPSATLTRSTLANPAAPVLQLVGTLTTSATFRWTAPAPNGSPITGYKMYAAPHGDTQTLVATIGPTNRYSFEGLSPSTSYDFSFEAVSAVGSSTRSATYTVSTLTVLDPGAVGDAVFREFPGLPAAPPRYMRSRLWDTNMSSFLGDLVNAYSNHIDDPSNEIGGGSLIHHKDKPGGDLLVGGRIVQAQLWDIDTEAYANAYLWRIEDNPKVTISPTTGERLINAAGRGVAQDFETVQVDPFGGPEQIPWGDIRSFGWQAPELTDSAAPWGAPNVRSIQALKTGLPPYGLGGKPYGWPNPLSPWLWGQAPVGGADPVGFSYFRYRFTLNREVDVTFYVTADDLFVAALNDVDIIDFQADKGDAGGATYWRKHRLKPGEYTFAVRVENLERPGIAENCGLLNVCATYSISPTPTTPWRTNDTQRFLFTTAGWSANTFDVAQPGFYVERFFTSTTITYYASPSAHSVYGVWVPPGGGLVVEPGNSAPAGYYVEPSEATEGLEIVYYDTETVHSVKGVRVDNTTGITAPSSGVIADESVGHGHPQGWKALAYPSQPPGMTPGKIFLILLREAIARGELPGWGVTFSETHDSSGTPWPGEVPEFTCRIGTTYLEVLNQLQEQGFIHWAVAADALTLHLFAADHDFGVQPATFAEGVNIKYLTHGGKWGMQREKILARTQDGWIRRGSGPRQAMLSIPDWTDRGKIDAYLDQQIARSQVDASTVALDFLPLTAATTPFVGFRNFQAVTAPAADGTPYTPAVKRMAADENPVGPPSCSVDFESLRQRAEALISKVQDRSAPGVFNGRAASIAPYAKSQPQGGELKLIEVKFNLTGRADGAATNAISDGLTYADSNDERPSGRYKIQRSRLTASALQVGEENYTGYSIVQLLYNGAVGHTMVLGPGEFQQDDYFGSNYIDPRTRSIDPYPNWFLETGPFDALRVQLVSAGTHRNLLYTIWGYEVP